MVHKITLHANRKRRGEKKREGEWWTEGEKRMLNLWLFGCLHMDIIVEKYTHMIKHLCYALSSQTVSIEKMAKMNKTRRIYTVTDIHTNT